MFQALGYNKRNSDVTFTQHRSFLFSDGSSVCRVQLSVSSNFLPYTCRGVGWDGQFKL